jgi:hypothetical protein
MNHKFLRCLVLFAVAVGFGAIDRHPWVAEASSSERVNFTYVSRSWRTFTAGHTYIVETRDLKKRHWWQSANADTVLYILDGDNIVARNDDWGGLRSLVTFTPSVTKSYLVIVRSYRTATLGYFDLYIDNGRVANDRKFGGARMYSKWKPGECFQTTSLSSGDPYAYLIDRDYVGGRMYRDDDGGSGLNSKVCVNNERSGYFVLGSWSQGTEGRSRVNLYWHSYHNNPAN